MKRVGIFLSILVLLVGLTVSAHATLVDMHDGTIYDTDTQLSWLKDAGAGGVKNWTEAKAWAEGLNVNGLTGWRLPTTTQPDASCSDQYNPGSGLPLQGYGFNCTGSEMGHLYYALGNAAGGPLTNTGPFTNLQADIYWSGTEWANNPGEAWDFVFSNGYTYNSLTKSYGHYAWAARPGARSSCSQSDLDAAYQQGYQAVMQAMTNNGTTQCAYYDFFNSTLHIPCLSLSGTNYWLDMGIYSGDPLLFNLTNYGMK